MGTFETAVAAYYEDDEEEEERCFEFEPLPTLLEDEENVSLADILSLRDSCLSEQEVWAVCLECVLSLRSIAHSPLFHTLCITPDTLAFNAHGNVCFMEHLSDDPEGSFTPPEFDRTGNTFEGHVFSLGTTLAVSLDFVIEPELQPELGPEVKRLLDRMQQERPEDRPSIQNIVTLAKVKLRNVSSLSICRKLSAIGRRVLSIESVGTFQDGLETSCGIHEQQLKAKRQFHEQNPVSGLSSIEDLSPDLSNTEHIVRSQREEHMFDLRLDSRSQNSSPVRRRIQEQGGRTRGVLNRSSSVPDSNNPPPIQPQLVDLNATVTDLTEIGSEEFPVNVIIKSMMARKSRHSHLSDREEHDCSAKDGCGETGGLLGFSPDKNHNIPQSFPGCAQDPESALLNRIFNGNAPTDSVYNETSVKSILYTSNHMTKSMLCLNEETQDEWISLKELLSHSYQPLSVNELWGLCYICLSTLQTYIDYPAYLCLESVYISCEGEMLFLKTKNTGSCDAFYLAPEFQEHGIVTEKACVYGVAAILWSTAKFNLSPNQKLAMPRKLKRLLLEMAKRTPIERPSIVAAKKSCRDYLLRQRTTPEEVWAKLINRLCKSDHWNKNIGSPRILDTKKRSDIKVSSNSKMGFAPMTGRDKLSPVQGPIPKQYCATTASSLPDAFTSSATHFKPIVLAQDGTTTRETLTQQGTGGKSENGSNNHLKAKPEHKDNALMEYVPRVPKEDAIYLGSQESVCLPESSTSSSGKMLVNSPSLTTAQHTECEGQTLPHHCSSTSAFSTNQVTGSMYNSYLLRQDPKTGLLTLFPVHIAAPEPIPGLNINIPPLSAVASELVLSSVDQGAPKTSAGSWRSPAAQNAEASLTPLASPQMDRVPKHKDSGGEGGREQSLRSLAQSPAEQPLSTQVHPSLQAVMNLIRAEFGFDSYLENGAEDLKMGEYIFSLRDLQYDTFCSAVSEKFLDFCWNEKLLEALYNVVNRKQTSLSAWSSTIRPVSNVQPSSKVAERAATSPQGGEHSTAVQAWEPNHVSSDRDNHANTGKILRRSLSAPEPQSSCATVEKPEELHQDVNIAIGNTSLSAPVEGMKGGEVATGDADFNENSVGVADEIPPNTEPSWWMGGAEGDLGRGCHDQRSLDFSEDMEDMESLTWDGCPLSAVGELDGHGCSPGWALAFYGGDYFRQDVLNYVKKLGQHSEEPCIETKQQELHQQLMIETRNLKKTRNFYQKLMHQERKNKGSDAKTMLSKLQGQLEEMQSKVEFLDSVKKYLEVLCMDNWGVETPLLPSLAAHEDAPLVLMPSEGPSVLCLQSAVGRGRSTQTGISPLLAGTPLGLMSYLYSRNAYLEGYVQQFLYTYRYFCTPKEFLQFLMNKLRSTAGQEASTVQMKVYHRSLDLLHSWLENCRQLDFPPKSSLMQTLEDFLTREVIPVDSEAESLLAVLQSSPKRRNGRAFSSQCCNHTRLQEEDDAHSVRTLCKQLSEDSGKRSFQWRISRVVEPQAIPPREKAYCIAAALPRPCYSSLVDNLSSSCLKTEERHPFFQNEHSTQCCAQQLTLLQQEIFQGCHPVHFLNSRAQGVRDKAICITKPLSPDSPPVEGSSLFVQEATVQDKPLIQLLKHDENVSNWVSAEIVICDSIKAQAGLLSKFLMMAKYCYESRNFATAIQILGGLENVIVRQLPAWKHLSAKVCEVLEELKAVQVFLKSDNLCLMEGEQFKRQPTLPAALILAMHVQQLEIGAFTLASGAYKWPKLRNIAKVVSQIHAFQENKFTYVPDRELQTYLRQRIAYLSDCDIALLAAENDTNFQQILAERHSKRIQDTLRKVKATFQ
ncbi:kinase non-catalytic C-lobe domain-containing protein 1 isoform X2 [Paramormyrops kingsleyae]|uniref:Kinase non-catalytic C-lobe domain containing 1 n=1 Tax=Paramormyrops kingsleyae TaxID=1676925 RepID=A0A3B3TFV4_9TELE|nr:protein very KIND isoform X1 [Paramormyrops kingsleyae]XP_023696667.1 protein very KIND isoform X1 [Paramormyrops kingsleyae]